MYHSTLKYHCKEFIFISSSFNPVLIRLLVIKDPLKNNFQYFVDPHFVKDNKSESLGKKTYKIQISIFLLLDLADLVKLL